MGGTPGAASGSVFDDVGASDFAADEIEDLAGLNVTEGCDTDNFCPTQGLTKIQAAIILWKAKHGLGNDPGTATGTVFDDVGVGDFGADYIEGMFGLGYVDGCDTDKFCPGAVLTKAGFARQLSRTFELVPP